jgi:hypothetical protein
MMGEIMPNKYKLLGLVFIAVPSVIATGFGPYLSMSITRTPFLVNLYLTTIGLSLYYNASWRRVVYCLVSPCSPANSSL